jgi:hypothetical protein
LHKRLMSMSSTEDNERRQERRARILRIIRRADTAGRSDYSISGRVKGRHRRRKPSLPVIMCLRREQ